MATDEPVKNGSLCVPENILGAMTIAAGLIDLLGWALGVPGMTSLGAGLIPMAPSTALLFALSGGAVCLGSGAFGAGARRAAAVPGAVALAGALALFVLSLAGVHSEAEHLGFSISGRVGGAPVGHISPATALCFVIAGLSFMLSLPAGAGRRLKASFALASLLLAVNGIFLLGYLLGAPLLYGGPFIPPALNTVLAFLSLGAALAVSSGKRMWPAGEMDDAARRASRVLIACFAVAAVGIGAAGISYNRHYERQFRKKVEQELSTIADSKVRELSQWKKWRMGDASIIFGNTNFSERAGRYLINPEEAENARRLNIWMRKLQAANDYDRVALYDAGGVERMAAPAAVEDAFLSRRVAAAAKAGRVVFEDFYRSEEDGRVYLAVMTPIIDEGEKRAIGVLAFHIDPEHYLYPLIKQWPTPSRTAETLLVRREGNHAVFLNELRFRKNTALRLRKPLSRRDMPAVQAALGRAGIMEGVDYRGVSVLAATRAVPGTPWFMVARMDMSEVSAPVRERLWFMVALMAALITGAGTGVEVLWRRENARSFREKLTTFEALRKSEERFRGTLDNMMEGCQIVAFDWRYLYINEAAAAHGRRSRGDLIGRTMMEVFPGIEATEMFAALRRCMKRRRPEKMENEFVFPDGASAWFELVVQPVPEGIFILSMDITGRKQATDRIERLDMELRQSQKMEAVGRLAGGIAHDFNNMLTVINNYAEFGIAALRPGDPLRADMEEILQAGRRSAELTRQLLAFSRKQVLAPEIIDMNRIVGNMEKMIRRLIGEDIAFVTRLAPGLGRVKADPSQMESALMNLVVNSRDAMPGGGKLTIETGNVTVDEDYASRHREFAPGEYAMLTVTDTGGGMDAATIERIFDPFFTTKDAGRGTGLGLSTVHGIVKQSGGHIWVYSEPGRGTTFKIHFPIASAESEKEAAVKKAAPAPGGTETVLVVEDEAGVRDILKRVLTAAGYTVLAAANGGEALLMCERHEGAIGLIITDVVMPEMSGRELAERLALIRPGAKVLYMSGYTENAIVHHGVLDEGIHFISKPFSVTSLKDKVREVLDG